MVMAKRSHETSEQERVRQVLKNFPQLSLAILFGSVASGSAGTESDLDLAVSAQRPLRVAEKIDMIEQLATVTGRPVDLIDLQEVTEPLLGQILRHGKRLLGSDTLFGNLISRHIFEQADFMPYKSRILAERRKAWIDRS
jgi:predicted nucleotidyltransferase